MEDHLRKITMPRNYKINNKTALIIFLIYILSFWLAACSEENLPLNNPSVKQATPTQELKNFNIVQTDNGQKQWELEAKEAKIYEQKHQAIATDIKVKFFEKDVISSILTADRGNMDSASGDMEVEGNVVVKSLVEQTTIETTKLWYIAKERKIFSDQFIKQTRPDAIITGYGLEADVSLKQVVIKKDIKAEVIDPKYQKREQ